MDDRTITMPMETYIDLLERRLGHIQAHFGWDIPDIVFDYFIGLLREGCVPNETDPWYIVDNMAVNGNYGEFREYMRECETRDDFIARVEDDCMAIFPEEDYIIYSLGF